MTDRTTPHGSHRSARDRSMVLMIVGAVLFLPPVAGVFLIDGTIAGLPIPLFYLFAVWIVLIAAAAALSRSLREGEESSPTAEAVESKD